LESKSNLKVHQLKVNLFKQGQREAASLSRKSSLVLSIQVKTQIKRRTMQQSSRRS